MRFMLCNGLMNLMIWVCYQMVCTCWPKLDVRHNRMTFKSFLHARIMSFWCRFGHGMYLNEPWKDNPYWKEDFWGTENYERLLTIKHRYDQDNFFTCHHCVGSDLETDEDKTRPDYTSSANKLITSLPAFAIFCLVLSMFV